MFSMMEDFWMLSWELVFKRNFSPKWQVAEFVLEFVDDALKEFANLKARFDSRVVSLLTIEANGFSCLEILVLNLNWKWKNAQDWEPPFCSDCVIPDFELGK